MIDPQWLELSQSGANSYGLKRCSCHWSSTAYFPSIYSDRQTSANSVTQIRHRSITTKENTLSCLINTQCLTKRGPLCQISHRHHKEKKMSQPRRVSWNVGHNGNKPQNVASDQGLDCLPLIPLRKHAYSNILQLSPPKKQQQKTESFQIKILIFFKFLPKT